MTLHAIQLFAHGSTRFTCLVLNSLDDLGLTPGHGYFDDLLIPKLSI
jgi:hypothetical protein